MGRRFGAAPFLLRQRSGPGRRIPSVTKQGLGDFGLFAALCVGQMRLCPTGAKWLGANPREIGGIFALRRRSRNGRHALRKMAHEAVWSDPVSGFPFPVTGRLYTESSLRKHGRSDLLPVGRPEIGRLANAFPKAGTGKRFSPINETAASMSFLQASRAPCIFSGVWHAIQLSRKRNDLVDR
jgi:hypothetical protein